MRVRGIDRASCAGRVITEVASWPQVRPGRPSCGVGVALTVGAREIVHVHRDDEAELCLTRPVIARLRGAWTSSGREEMEPHGDWVSMRLDGEADVALAVALVSVAIKATDDRPQPVSTERKPACSVAVHRSR